MMNTSFGISRNRSTNQTYHGFGEGVDKLAKAVEKAVHSELQTWEKEARAEGKCVVSIVDKIVISVSAPTSKPNRA